MVTLLELCHSGADVFNDPYAFMAKGPSRLAAGYISFQDMCISTTNSRIFDCWSSVRIRSILKLITFNDSICWIDYFWDRLVF